MGLSTFVTTYVLCNIVGGFLPLPSAYTGTAVVGISKKCFGHHISKSVDLRHYCTTISVSAITLVLVCAILYNTVYCNRIQLRHNINIGNYSKTKI